jgi:hypothetical protein
MCRTNTMKGLDKVPKLEGRCGTPAGAGDALEAQRSGRIALFPCELGPGMLRSHVVGCMQKLNNRLPSGVQTGVLAGVSGLCRRGRRTHETVDR